MALQTSGAITVDDIYQELGNSNIASAGGVSLLALENGSFGTINSNSSNKPNGSTPCAMSEWYGYNHSAGASVTQFQASSNQSSPTNACKQTFYQFLYHDGAGADPVAGDFVYINTAGTKPTGAGFYKYQTSNSYFEVQGTAGEITTVGGCRSERRLKYNIEFIGNSLMGIPMYHFEYINPKHAPNGPGRYVGTMVDDLQRLGYDDVILEKGGELWVDYKKLDIDCKLV